MEPEREGRPPTRTRLREDEARKVDAPPPLLEGCLLAEDEVVVATF